MTSSAAPHAQNSSAFTAFDSSGFSIGGSNGRNNLVTIDGGENEYGSGTLRTPNISIDSVQEFQVNGSPFLAAGPFNVSGDKNLPSTEPLGFTAASNPRQIHGLRVAF